jgi:hypothetical protein
LIIAFSLNGKESYGQNVTSSVVIGSTYATTTSITIWPVEYVTLFAHSEVNSVDVYFEYKNRFGS